MDVTGFTYSGLLEVSTDFSSHLVVGTGVIHSQVCEVDSGCRLEPQLGTRTAVFLGHFSIWSLCVVSLPGRLSVAQFLTWQLNAPLVNITRDIGRSCMAFSNLTWKPSSITFIKFYLMRKSQRPSWVQDGGRKILLLMGGWWRIFTRVWNYYIVPRVFPSPLLLQLFNFLW